MEAALGLTQIAIGDADLLEAEGLAPLLEVAHQGLKLG